MVLEEDYLTDDRVGFLKLMSFSDGTINKYKNIIFSEEDSKKLEELINNYDLKKQFDIKLLKRICETEYFSLSSDIMTTLIIYLVERTGYSFFTIFSEEISVDQFNNNELKKQVFLTMDQTDLLSLSLQDVFQYCLVIFEKTNDILFYQRFSKLIDDELFAEIINDFLSEPKKEMNHLVIFCLQNKDRLKTFVENYHGESFEVVLFLVQACLELASIDREFTYKVVNEKIITKIDNNWDEIILVNNYLRLLFTLLLDQNDENLLEEINRMITEFKSWDPKSIIYLAFGKKKRISKDGAEGLCSIIFTLPEEQTKGLKHEIDYICSCVEDSHFMRFYLPILSVIGVDEKGKTFSRIEDNLKMYSSALIKIVCKVENYFTTALNILKILYEKEEIHTSDFEEKYFLKFLKSCHNFIPDANFVCNMSIDLYLASSDSSVKSVLYKYIESSICDNYFYLLQNKVAELNSSSLRKLDTELKSRKEIYEKSWSNPDLQPSEKNMDIYYEAKSEFNRKLNEEAEKESVLSQLIQKQTILYGNKIQYKQFDEEGNLHSQVNKMKEVSQSTYIPIRFINDPLFFQLERQLVIGVNLYDD